MAIKLNDPMRSKIIDLGVVGQLGTTGVLKVYTGTQPETGGGTSGTSVLLVTISDISWNSASNGTATITGNATGTAATSGVAAWARLTDTTGTAYIVDGNCGTSTEDFVLDATSISAEAVVTLTAATLVQPAA
jgi:hypothetical protein